MDRPSALFKFRALSESAWPRIATAIAARTIYFASPSSFNDPFDCQPSFDGEGSLTDVQRYVEANLKLRHPELSHRDRRKRAKQAAAAVSFPEWGSSRHSFMEKEHQKFLDSAGVFCASASFDNALMWGHYADAHRGICLCYDARRAPFDKACPVVYAETRAQVRPFRQSFKEMIDHAFFRKASEWAYENEWRVVRATEGSGTVSTSALFAVILGARASADDRKRIEALVSKSGSIKLYSAHLSRDVYRITVS